MHSVNWHEARAYCRWLSTMLAESPALAANPIARLVREQGWQLAMPSELEWEKAARGTLKNAVYSWGDAPDPQRANYADSSVADTSAVGSFPANGFGLHDMLGNVFEWTRSAWRPYPYEVDDPTPEGLSAAAEVRLVVRGGSWLDSADYARCASRNGFHPVNRYLNLGFRVVLRSAGELHPPAGAQP